MYMPNVAQSSCFSAAIDPDPQARWAVTAQYVDGLRDALGKPVDADIKPLVIALNASGLPTTASYEGHLNWGVPAPWVDVRPDPTRESAALRRELNSIDTEIETIERGDSDAAALDVLGEKRRLLSAKIRLPTLNLARNLMTLLAAFYRDRCVPYDQTISLHVRFIGFRMQCHGTVLQDIAMPAEKIANLQRYQEEMHTFAAFLAASYQQRVDA
jgi:hypothetical protein